MEKKQLRESVFSGIFWKLSERIGAQVVTFIVSIVLARLLEPSDYGSIAMITVFISIANVFVSDGFGTALIQKKDADNIDFSTVFYFNIVFSIIIYIVIFSIAPFVASFYKMDILCPTMRVLGLKLILAGINSVQQAYVSKHMIFKKFFFSTIIGTIVSAVVGILMAIRGFGIWALVAQYLTNSTMDTIILWITVKWRPNLTFSFRRMKGLFKYGWKILLTALIGSIYNDLRNFIIGKKYSSEDLAYYNKGKNFPNLVITNVNTAISSVIFPAISSIQDNRQKVKEMTRRSMKIGTFIIFPIMVGLAIIGKNFIRVLLTDKWIDSTIYLQIACVHLSFMPLQTANTQAINALGRSDITLKLEIIKKTLGILLIIISMNFGVTAIAGSAIIASVCFGIINAFPNKKLLNYSYLEQIRDIGKNLILALIMGIVVYIVGLLPINVIMLLIIQIATGGIFYILLSILTKNEEYAYILNILRTYMKKIKAVREK